MGREIRMVPPNWEHPKNEHGRLQPMYDEHYSQAVKEWKDAFAAWERGERPSYFDAAEYPDGLEYWEWESGPPDREYYRPWKDEEATWFQVWETVSEGTPVTPPFETREELADYLATHGDFWDQQRGDGPWSRESADRFCSPSGGWAPSMAVVDGKMFTAKDMPDLT